MRKSSGKSVLNPHVACAKASYFSTALTLLDLAYTHSTSFVHTFCTLFCTYFYTIIQSVLYLFEQLLYPSSTALIIRTINI